MKQNDSIRFGAKSTRILVLLLVASVTIGAQIAFGVDEDRQRATQHEWRLTANANLRTASGDCAATASTPVCRELCLISTRYGTVTPTGTFDCFAD